MFAEGHTPAHKGRTTTTDPITDIAVVAKIKRLLEENVRDLALWTVAVQSAYRVGDLCRLRWIDTTDDGTTITLRVLEGKSKRPRIVPLPPQASHALRMWRYECDSEFIFSGKRGQLTTATFGRMVKEWCRRAGVQGQYAAHTTRKTWVRLQVDHFGTSLPVVSTAIGHHDVTQTLRYCGKLQDGVRQAYANEL